MSDTLISRWRSPTVLLGAVNKGPSSPARRLISIKSQLANRTGDSRPPLALENLLDPPGNTGIYSGVRKHKRGCPQQRHPSWAAPTGTSSSGIVRKGVSEKEEAARQLLPPGVYLATGFTLGASSAPAPAAGSIRERFLSPRLVHRVPWPEWNNRTINLGFSFSASE